MAFITPSSSIVKVDATDNFFAKQTRQFALLSLKMAPQAEIPGFLREAPSVLRFTHLGIRGCQITSFIEGALGVGSMLTLKTLIYVEEDVVFKELL